MAVATGKKYLPLDLTKILVLLNIKFYMANFCSEGS